MSGGLPTPFRADGLCPRCEKRPATTDIGPVADWRYRTPSCEQCVVEEQLEHARERRDAIPELEARLAELTGGAEGSEIDGGGSGAVDHRDRPRRDRRSRVTQSRGSS